MRADGSEFPIELAITAVDLPGPPLFTGYIRDITERKRVEAESERALQAEREAGLRLRVLDEMKNTFLQAVSHDLRTPLTAILGLALTLDRGDLDLALPDRADLTRRLATNARKLERILSNLLDLERLIRGVVEPTLKPVDVGSLVRQILEEADFLGKRQVHVQAGTVVADVDAVKIERIVENLLVNAARHTPEGTPIWVRVCPEQGGVLLQWKMQGSGCRRMPGRESSSLSNRVPETILHRAAESGCRLLPASRSCIGDKHGSNPARGEVRPSACSFRAMVEGVDVLASRVDPRSCGQAAWESVSTLMPGSEAWPWPRRAKEATWHPRCGTIPADLRILWALQGSNLRPPPCKGTRSSCRAKRRE